MRIIELNQETKDSLLENLLKRSPGNYGQYEQTVNEIIADVRARKDQALFEYTSRFDKCELTKETIKVTECLCKNECILQAEFTEETNVEENKSTTVKKTVKSGITFGSALAMVISYTTWKSVGWAIFHGLLSWVYVIYFLLRY